MSDLVAISMVAAIPGSLAAMVTIVNTILVQKAQERHERMLIKTSKTIEILEKNTNSIKDALVKTTGEAEFAKGKIAGAIEEKEK